MMKRLILLSLTAVAVLAQAPPAGGPAVTINGRDYTSAELENLVRQVGGSLPAQFNSDRKAFLETLALTQRLEEEARKAGLDKKEPYATQLAYNTMLFLAQSMLNEKNKSFSLLPEQQKAHYDANKSRYASARVKVLYLSFSNTPIPGVTTRTEAEAAKLAEKIAAEAKAGGDFVALVRKYSEDQESKEKNGDFPPVKAGDKTLPPAIAETVFKLKPGEVSAPLRQPNGFYLFRLEGLDVTPYEEVRDRIFMELQEEALKQWVESVRKSAKVEFRDESFLKAPAQR